jgi:hypothetical protein
MKVKQLIQELTETETDGETLGFVSISVHA